MDNDNEWEQKMRIHGVNTSRCLVEWHKTTLSLSTESLNRINFTAITFYCATNYSGYYVGIWVHTKSSIVTRTSSYDNKLIMTYLMIQNWQHSGIQLANQTLRSHTHTHTNTHTHKHTHTHTHTLHIQHNNTKKTSLCYMVWVYATTGRL